MSDKTDFYRRLNIGTGASEAAIKKAYRLAVKKAHPDVNKNEGATQHFLDIQEAYQVLSDPSQKDTYDSSRTPGVGIPTFLTNIEYSQQALVHLEEPQVIYALVDILATADDQSVSELPLNLSLVVDNSTSMAGARLDMVRVALKEIVEDLDQDDKVSLISFNDFSKVLLPSQIKPSARQVESSVNNFLAEGGTELFQGLEAGYDQIKRARTKDYINHIILITDGHTYGDEDSCLALAKKAAEEDIGISGMGIGVEWNDSFVDQLCALTGGQSQFVQDLQQIKEFLTDRITALKEADTRRLNLDILPAPDVKVLSAFRILPEAIPLPHQQSFSLGILKKHQPHRILFEFLINPIPKEIDRVVIAAGEFSLKKKGRDLTIPITLDRVIVDHTEEMEPPIPELIRAISHLTFYNLQEKAQHDLANGNPKAAFQRLMNLSSQLNAKGESGLAKIAMNEAQYIRSHNNFSPTGKKELKYGTRNLMLPDKT
jgi:Ca-activated chloride channel family protein